MANQPAFAFFPRLPLFASRVTGIDTLWPGCDLYPPTPLENLRVLTTT